MSNVKQQDTPQNPASFPMRISDAASALRRRIDKNERPYTQEVLRGNNKLVDEWESKVLRKIASKDGKIPAGSVYGEWEYFYMGKTLPQFIESYNQGLVSRPRKEVVDYWVKYFTEKSIGDMVELGAPLVGHGWKLIIDETFITKNLERWEKIYSKSNDPLDWRKLANDHPKLWNLEHESPFWTPEEAQDVSQKVMTVLKTPVQPMM